MKNGIIRNDYMIQQLDFVDQNVGWGTLHDILHVAKKETVRGGHFMTYYTTSTYYGRTRMHDNIVP